MTNTNTAARTELIARTEEVPTAGRPAITKGWRVMVLSPSGMPIETSPFFIDYRCPAARARSIAARDSWAAARSAAA